MPPIYVMLKPVSGSCNLACDYCFYRNEMNNRTQASYGSMSEEALDCVIRKTLEFADRSCTFSFQGGEPTLAGLEFYRKVLQLEQKYNRKKVAVHNVIQTNGYHLDPDWCRFFAEHDILVGLSIDGVRTAHDACRRDTQGNGTYRRVLESARMLSEAGVHFHVLTVVNGRTAPKVERIYEQYRKQGFHWQQYIACLDPLEEVREQPSYTLTPEAYGRFLITLFDLWERDVRRGEAPYIRQFENYLDILQGKIPESCEQRGICSYQTVIEADASVYPCDFYVLDEYKLGNLLTDSYEQIQERRMQMGFVEQSLQGLENCKSCPYVNLCRGGCRRHRQMPNGKIGENKFCRSYQMFFGECLERMQAMSRSSQK